MKPWMTGKSFGIQESRVLQLLFTSPVRLALRCSRSSSPSQSENCTGRRHASVFHQHYPTRKRSPWMPKRPQVPHDISRENTDSPDDHQQRPGRRQKWQQPRTTPTFEWATRLIRCSLKWRYMPFTNEQWDAAVFHVPESLIQVSLQRTVRARCVPFNSAS